MPFPRYHKILIFRGSLSFHNQLCCILSGLFIIMLCIGLTMNLSYLCISHQKIYSLSLRLTFVSISLNLYHSKALILTIGLQKDRFRWVVLKTSESKEFLHLTTLCKEGNWYLSGLLLTYLSSQNLTCKLSPAWNDPHLKNLFFIFISPEQKWGSPGLLMTCDRDFNPKYLFFSICFQVSSSFSRLNNHLLTRATFLVARSTTPRPPNSFGWQTMFHLVSLYFFF
jgi:hypothetical protein